ncbi:MAG: GHMP kinase [Crocinitomicaceae bacterium]|nr:GHMP kinase [Crocinitomicaceae bacterium]
MSSVSENKTFTYSAAGKLMLFGEYLVLQGAKSLAFPLKFGQVLKVSSSDKILHWEAFANGEKWFWVSMDDQLNLIDTNNTGAAEMLQSLFKYIKHIQPDLDLINHYEVKANFNLQWGLGSSSTLVSLLSQWSDVDPYEMLANSFGGSGYDIAAATAQNPIIYQIRDNQKLIEEVQLNREITDKCLFIYLGKKQNSRNEIKKFTSSEVTEKDIIAMNGIVEQAIKVSTIEEFEALLNRSEDILSFILGREKLKDHIFADYKYSIKSLGAWGGDFFLATFRDLDEARNYFKMKGLTTQFTYSELVK